ncbi:glycosyltransferase [Rathayibacter soli]|uniref:glycosyltransferase n=1 Tax=Rathayibacter soli TaxID=3144168 RepID=UPI0027E45A8F|nr:glycosyltransferase [Glaciibacter superstes]
MSGIAGALRHAGDQVQIGSGGRPNRSGLAQPEMAESFTLLAEIPDPAWRRIHRVWRGLSWGASTSSWIKRMKDPPDAILVYGTSLGYLLRLIPLARRLNVPLVIDAVEWQKSSHLPGGRFGPFAVANAISMRLMARRASGVIVISRYLEQHFAHQGSPTLRVPPLFSVGIDRGRAHLPDRPLSLCYVGSPGQKDKRTVRNLVLMCRDLEVRQTELRIDIVGVDRHVAASLIGRDAAVSIDHPSLQFHGRVSADQAREVVAHSHFSVLQREDERYTRAGFPSKVAESLILGTPVMTNMSSDLSDYLTDGVNAKVLADASTDALAQAVSAMITTQYDYDAETIASTARGHFSPEKYGDSLHAFLVRLRDSAAFTHVADSAATTE